MGKSVGSAWGAITGQQGGAGIFGSIGGAIAGDKIGEVTGLNATLTGAFDDESSQSSVSRVILGKESELESNIAGGQLGDINQLRNLLMRGGEAQAGADIDAARGAQLSLAQMLQQAQSGPSSQNILDAQGFANSIFAPQEQAMQQQFKQAETETSRLAARLGRQVDDPILRAKLAESQAVQMGQLGAQKGAFTAQTAQGFQNQALQMQNQLAQVRGGLATQALQNRQTLMGMGQSLLNQERQFRLNTATRTGNATQTQQGGWGDVIGAATGIAGTFMGLGK